MKTIWFLDVDGIRAHYRKRIGAVRYRAHVITAAHEVGVSMIVGLRLTSAAGLVG